MDDAPEDVEYFPISQSTQVLEPLMEEYLPIAQSKQSEGSVLPSVGRYWPARQSWQEEREDA